MLTHQAVLLRDQSRRGPMVFLSCHRKNLFPNQGLLAPSLPRREARPARITRPGETESGSAGAQPEEG